MKMYNVLKISSLFCSGGVVYCVLTNNILMATHLALFGFYLAGLVRRRINMFWKAFGLFALLGCVMRGYQGNLEGATFCAVFACLGLVMARLEEKGE